MRLTARRAWCSSGSARRCGHLRRRPAGRAGRPTSPRSSASGLDGVRRRPTAFTEPVAPLREILDQRHLTHGRLASTGGFNFGAWRFGTDANCWPFAATSANDSRAIPPADQTARDDVAAARSNRPDGLPRGCARHGRRDRDGNRLPDSLVDLLGDALGQRWPIAAGQAAGGETVGTDSGGAAALVLLTEMLEPKVPRAAWWRLRWLRGRAGPDPVMSRRPNVSCWRPGQWTPVALPLLSLAASHSDRGDAERGLALLRRAGAEPDHPLVRVAPGAARARKPRRDLGRNEACWCGSGLKAHKKCHLGRERCRWPSGWAGCMPRHPSTHCRATGPACWPESQL